MDEIEQTVQLALSARLAASGISPEILARYPPRAVVTRYRADFIVGHLRWTDAAGQSVDGPALEVSQSRPMGKDRLVADFIRSLVDTWPQPFPTPQPFPASTGEVVPLRRPHPVRAGGRLTPAFLIGAPGAALHRLQRLLLAHPAICGGAESHFLPLFAASLGKAARIATLQLPEPGPLASCGRDALAQSLRTLWAEVFAEFHARHPAARLHLDRAALQEQALADLHGLFPRAPVVVILRESRREGAADLAAAQAFLRACPDQPVLLVRAGDLRADPRAVLMRVLAHLLPPDLPRSLPPATEALLATTGQQAAAKARRGWARKLLGWRPGRKKDATVG